MNRVLYEKLYTRSNGPSNNLYFKGLEPGGAKKAEVEVKTEAKETQALDGNKTVVRKDILNPLFNLREVLKQILLLEDHLFHRDRRCGDCIRKHNLLIEAFLEEAVSLDVKGVYTVHIESLIDDYKSIASTFFASSFADEDFRTMAQGLRKMRKSLVIKYNFFSAELLFKRAILKGDGETGCESGSCSLTHTRQE